MVACLLNKRPAIFRTSGWFTPEEYAEQAYYEEAKKEAIEAGYTKPTWAAAHNDPGYFEESLKLPKVSMLALAELEKLDEFIMTMSHVSPQHKSTLVGAINTCQTSIYAALAISHLDIEQTHPAPKPNENLEAWAKTVADVFGPESDAAKQLDKLRVLRECGYNVKLTWFDGKFGTERLG